jgi:hypothetical protein
MKIKDETDKLEATIIMLETIMEEEETQLKEQFKQSVQGLQPIRLVKSTLEKLANPPEFKEDLIDTSISLITGYFSKKLFFGSSKNSIKQAVGNLMQIGIAAYTSRHVEELRQFTSIFMTDLFSKKEKADKN